MEETGEMTGQEAGGWGLSDEACGAEKGRQNDTDVSFMMMQSVCYSPTNHNECERMLSRVPSVLQ